ncbi:MAG: PrgI family protein [Oscillospiraceae bacterium]|jgi:hypothetical protein|nr:PrgI family protein [Oscillospiraceae bacterium]
MAYVPVPKDLTKIKTKVALNLTKRQLLCFSLAAVIGVPAYLLTRGAIGGSGAVFLMIGLMLPFFFMAMYEKDGLSAEKVIRNYIRAKLWPGVRPYRTVNIYIEVLKITCSPERRTSEALASRRLWRGVASRSGQFSTCHNKNLAEEGKRVAKQAKAAGAPAASKHTSGKKPKRR